MSIPQTPTSRRDILIFIGVTLLLARLYLSITDLYLIGFELDDGYYYLGAKALAMGLGYHMPFFPGQPALVKYPPGLSCLLAPFIYMLPSFTAHAPLLKIINLSIAALSTGMFSVWASQQLAANWPDKKYLLLPFSFLGIGLLGLNPAWMNVATELLSEPLFCLISTVILWLSTVPPHELSRQKRHGAMLFFSLLLCYIRSFGLVMGLALSIWHWKEGRPKWSIATLLGIGLCILPWVCWGSAHPPTDIMDGTVLYRSFNESYAHSIVMDLTNEYSPLGLFTSGLSALIQYIAVSFFPFLKTLPEKFLLLVGFPLGLFFFYQLGKACLQKASPQKGFPLYQLYLLSYLLILPWWSFHQQYERFLLPLLPLLWVFLFAYVWQSTQTAWKKVGLSLLCLLLLVNAACYGQHFFEKLSHKQQGGDPLTQSLAGGTNPQNPRIWDEFQSIVEVVRKRTKPNDWIWTTELPLPTAIYAERPVWDYFSLIPHPPLTSIGKTSSGKTSTAQIQLVVNQMLDTLADSQWRQIRQRAFRYVLLAPEIKGGQITAATDPITQHLLRRHGQHFQLLECSKPAGSFCLLRINQAAK
ncbi:MAG: hypothetical protein K2X01_01335 [Cyanobacteria bacterium]|nr:hypothetical protein [Cyanobacteriota bacterium]